MRSRTRQGGIVRRIPFLAGIADVMGDDNIGAAFILIGAAAIIALIACADGEADEQT